MIEFHKRYSIPFTSPLQIGKTLVTHKEVLPFSFTENNKTYSFELSPLQGLHEESLDDAQKSLTDFIAGRTDNMLPSARFAYEGAKYIDNIQSMSVLINALYIPNNDSDFPENKTLKIKINRTSFEKDIEAINNLTQKGYKLRLDANRTLSEEQLYHYWYAINDHSAIEYFEEPLANSEAHLSLKEFIPIAFDESSENFIDIKLPENIVSFVIKPSVMLGIERTIELMKKQSIIVSSAFETPQQLLALIKLSTLQKDTAMGLDTLKYFPLEFIPNTLNYKSGQIIFNA